MAGDHETAARVRSAPGPKLEADEPASPAASPPIGKEAVPEGSTIADWENRFKYLLADFENFRKRADRDREAIRSHAEAELLRGLLPIHEAFERAREALGRAAPNDPMKKGLDLLAHEWNQFLQREGVRPIARVGAKFDAEDHEAVAEAPTRSPGAAGTILEVVQQGYRFRDGLLRIAKVVVARTPPPTDPPAPAPPPAPAEKGKPRDGKA
ncbi:MAG TPA: nucleotide exchange factor GrpE [Thermoplasmata archaeon]|nr:nucleotide exchange factor GrpE [Thermoplasmata archaeon]